ncbi:MAG: sugar phosphate isomerase/epimerase [Eubacteriales bacterium]|nr:sugar phosphate isomerase/epimerase [Eubacteriales bacterium]
MVFGMSTACFYPNIYIEQAIDIIADMRVKNVEVFFNCMSEYNMTFVKELKKRIDDRGISAYSIHALSLQFEPQLFSRYPRAREEAFDIYKQVLEAGAELGAGVYVFHGPSHVKRAKKMILDYPYIAERTDCLADTAKGYGIKLAWENVHWCWYSKPDFANELLDRVNTDNLYFTLDIKQAAQSGFDPVDFLGHTKGRLVNIHLCDYTHSENGITPALPFDGIMDFDAFRKALKEIEYDYAMILEVYSSNYTSHTQLQDNFTHIESYFSY